MARRAEARRAMTLLELTAVVVIIGLLGVMAATRYGSTTMADVGAQGFARRLALDCSHARRRAIATGDNHLLRFTLSGGKATQYALYRRQGGHYDARRRGHAVPADVTVTTGGVTDVEFTFTGEACVVHDHRSGARTARGPSPCRKSRAKRSCSSGGHAHRSCA